MDRLTTVKRRNSSKLESSFIQISKLIEKIETADENGLIELFPNARMRLQQLYHQRKQQIQKEFTTTLEKSLTQLCNDNNSMPFDQEMKQDLTQSSLMEQYTEFRKQIQNVLMYLQSADKFQQQSELKQIRNKSKRKMIDLGERFSNLDELAIEAIEKVWKQKKQAEEQSTNFYNRMTEGPGDDDQTTVSFIRKCSKFPNYKDYALILHEAYEKCNKIIESLQPQEDSLLDQIKCKLYSIIEQQFPTILKQKIQKLNQNSDEILNKVKNFRNVLLDRATQEEKIIKDLTGLQMMRKGGTISTILQEATQIQEKLGNKEIKIILMDQTISEVKSKLHNLVNSMIRLQYKQNEDENSEPILSSQYLIQPTRGSCKYVIFDLENNVQKQYEAETPFAYAGSGFVHLNSSLIISGGYTGSNYNKNTIRIFETGKDIDQLQDMQIQKSHHSMASIGEDVFSVGGFNLTQKKLDVVQRLQRFKDWSDQPNLPVKVSRCISVGVGDRFLYVMGGSNDQNNYLGVQMLNLQKIITGWVPVQVAGIGIQKLYSRQNDGVGYLQEKNKIVVFGDDDGSKFLEFEIKADKNLKYIQGGELQFAYQKDHIIVNKEYRGRIYSLNSNRDMVYKYNDVDHEWKVVV